MSEACPDLFLRNGCDRMIKRMLPVHIRELLGIGRSSMRYYIKKGLLSVKKDENNGYTYFDGGDLLELIDVAFYRNCMDADTDHIKKMTYASSLEEQERNYNEQICDFEEEIRRKQAYLEMLKDFDKQSKHLYTLSPKEPCKFFISNS